jgi:Rieske Fe-S protein
VVVTANVPVSNRLLLHTKIAAYRTYAVALTLERTPMPGLYWDLDDPYHYTRTLKTPGGEVVIVGGEDHKTGQEEDTQAPFGRLLDYCRQHFAVSSVLHHWSGQIIEPVDGLPLIGHNSASRNVFVATGYAGNGMTYGTLAGRILADLVLHRSNPYAQLYDATRLRPVARKEYVAENADYPLHLVKDRLHRADVPDLVSVPAGEGRIVSLRGQKVAVYRDEAGACHGLSPVCKHLGCYVHWNTAERSWDCPCHGARYDTAGKVLNGPSVHDLEPVALDE